MSSEVWSEVRRRAGEQGSSGPGFLTEFWAEGLAYRPFLAWAFITGDKAMTSEDGCEIRRLGSESDNAEVRPVNLRRLDEAGTSHATRPDSDISDSDMIAAS